jgi:hypothetical protein
MLAQNCDELAARRILQGSIRKSVLSGWSMHLQLEVVEEFALSHGT